MDLLLRLLEGIAWPGLTLFITVVLFGLGKRFLPKNETKKTWTLVRQLILFTLLILGTLVFLITLPLSTETKGQLIGLLGIVLSAGLALSSTSLLGNALAAMMIRFVNPFNAGDFVRVDGCFGRVISRGVFHTEIQTEDRELRIIPNLILATKPFDVIRSSTVLISATVSLGYDVGSDRIDEALLLAAKDTGLSDPFVFVNELGDFSVTYKVHGLLAEPEKLLSKRSKLRSAIMDRLHEAGIEIVSPTFMNQRQVNEHVFIPKGERLKKVNPDHGDDIIFDRAVVATELERDQERLVQLERRIEELEEGSNGLKSEELEVRKKDMELLKERIKSRMETEKKKLDE